MGLRIDEVTGELVGPGAFRCDPSVYDMPIEEWWCPVCGGAAHRTYRPGRPKVYCSNACRQRAYRARKRECARTIARPYARAAGALVVWGKWHALRAPREAVSGRTDQRGRQVTVCGAFARPATTLGRRSHYEFVDQLGKGCQTCTRLVAPTLDPRAPASEDHAGSPDARTQHWDRIMRLADALRARQLEAIRQRRQQTSDSAGDSAGA